MKTSLIATKFALLVTVVQVTAHPWELSNGDDQYILSLSWCLVIKWVAQFFPRPVSGNLLLSHATKICSACSQSLLGLRGNPQWAISIVKFMIMILSSFVSQAFLLLLSVWVAPPSTSHANVLSLICLPTGERWNWQVLRWGRGASYLTFHCDK